MVADGTFDGAPAESLLSHTGKHHEHGRDQRDDVDECRVAGEHVHDASVAPARRSGVRSGTESRCGVTAVKGIRSHYRCWLEGSRRRCVSQRPQIKPDNLRRSLDKRSFRRARRGPSALRVTKVGSRSTSARTCCSARPSANGQVAPRERCEAHRDRCESDHDHRRCRPAAKCLRRHGRDVLKRRQREQPLR